MKKKINFNIFFQLKNYFKKYFTLEIQTRMKLKKEPYGC